MNSAISGLIPMQIILEWIWLGKCQLSGSEWHVAALLGWSMLPLIVLEMMDWHAGELEIRFPVLIQPGGIRTANLFDLRVGSYPT